MDINKIKNKIYNITTLILDVDGVLTDGIMIYGDKEEFKNFYVRDGKGISLAKLAGIKVMIITAEKTNLILKRAKKLEIEKETFLGIKNKLKCLKTIIKKNRLDFKNIAAIGDDINDIPILEKVGLPIAVNDAVKEVKELVKKRGGFITKNKGGRGAVREAIETILKRKGVWKKIVEKDIQRQLKEEK